MVATVKKIGGSAVDYYTALEKDAKLDDYYASEGSGKWHKSRTHKQGEQVTREQFEAYVNGVDPDTGEPVFKNSKRGNRMSGVDLQFAPDKSVSALFATTKDRQLQAMIEQAHKDAVSDALNFIQAEGMQDQYGNKIDCPIAEFTHYTSREGDPQLHNHCVIINAGEAGLDTRPLFQARTSANAIYQAQLAHNLKELGYNLSQDETGRSFKVDGVSDELCQTWSKRRQQVVEATKAHLGDENATTKDNRDVADMAARNTRKKKGELNLSREELLQKHLEEAGGFTSDNLKQNEAVWTKASALEDEAPRDFRGKMMVTAVNSKFNAYKAAAEVLLEEGKPATIDDINKFIETEIANKNLVKFKDGKFAHADMIKLDVLAKTLISVNH